MKAIGQLIWNRLARRWCDILGQVVNPWRQTVIYALNLLLENKLLQYVPHRYKLTGKLRCYRCYEIHELKNASISYQQITESKTIECILLIDVVHAIICTNHSNSGSINMRVLNLGHQCVCACISALQFHTIHWLRAECESISDISSG